MKASDTDGLTWAPLTRPNGVCAATVPHNPNPNPVSAIRSAGCGASARASGLCGVSMTVTQHRPPTIITAIATSSQP